VAIGEAVAFVHDLGGGFDEAGEPILSFNVIRLGDVSSRLKVKWRIVPGTSGKPVKPGDFVGGALPSGTTSLGAVPLTAGSDPTKNAVRVDIPLTDAALAPSGKTYRVELLPLTGTTTVLGTDAVEGAL
jgi:hypothetical protein